MPVEKSGVLEHDLPDYSIDAVLGKGATSTVYRAMQKTLGRYVAIKRFAPETFLPEEATKRFEREAAMWAQFSHENLIHLYDYRLIGKTRYIILEYCDGIELRELLKLSVSLPPRVASAIGIQILSALEYVHRYGIVHRDVKPANLFVTKNGNVKLMDFGISLCPELEPMTLPGQILGTPAYMSPEQSLGQEIGSQSDLFSFGVVLFEMVEGCTPFAASTVEEAIREVRSGKYLKPSRKLPKALRKAIGRCLQKSLKRRIGSAADVRQLLEAHLTRTELLNPQLVIQEHLQVLGIARNEPRLFPDKVIDVTARSPLASTFSALKAAQLGHFRRFPWRAFLLGMLLILYVLWAYFGPHDLRPEWGLLFESARDAVNFFRK